MKIIKNKMYNMISAELAIFLVETSSFNVYFLFPDETPKVELTIDNISQYVDRYKKSRQKGVFDGAFFLCQELYGIVVTASEDGVYVNSKYDAHPDCNFN